jgi:hypothetical protein
LADTTHAELVKETYQAKTKATWENFRKDYESKIAEGLEASSREATRQSLDAFERLAKPKLLVSSTAEKIDKFATDRRKDEGRNGKKVSAATVNKDPRYIRLVLNIAHSWGLIARVPKIRFLN